MPSPPQALEVAARLMTDFAERTGLDSGRPPQRYLWTDAFAVCNFLGLARRTGESRYHELALRLVDQVHHVLGRYRPDDPRTGWLSGLGERDGEAQPTRGGLRIGKPRPERGRDQPRDDELEWDRDGQYFHYLTRWMHALDQVARASHEPSFNRWARELAEVGHAAFTYGPVGARRMSWKLSTDLARPLVASMGQHDPLDGLITAVQLQISAAHLPGTPPGPDLAKVVREYAAMLETLELRTTDPLGLGGLLADAHRVAQLMAEGAFADGALLARLLAAADEGLARYADQGDLRQPAARRLAFRELGLAIGLAALARLEAEVREDRARVFAGRELGARVARLSRYAPLGAQLVAFWLDPEHHRPRAWSEHRDINEVMLATSLCPDGFLVAAPIA